MVPEVHQVYAAVVVEVSQDVLHGLVDGLERFAEVPVVLAGRAVSFDIYF